jgi:hypothetical protein
MKLTARKRTHGVLSDIDDLLEDTRSMSARVAFDDLFPLNEDDEIIGEFWFDHGRLPYISEPEYQNLNGSGRQHSAHFCDNECCFVEVNGVKIGQRREQKSLSDFKPVLEPRRYEPTEDWDSWGNTIYVRLWHRNDIDALRYSLEFFGDPELVFIENHYGEDALTLDDDELVDLLDAVEANVYFEEE